LNQGIVELVFEVNKVLTVIFHRNADSVHRITAADPTNHTFSSVQISYGAPCIV